MKKYLFILSFVVIILGGVVFWQVEKSIAPISPGTANQVRSSSMQDNAIISEPTANLSAQVADIFQAPLDRAKERVTKKYFGIFINPKTSPVQPEKFSGYHTGTDFEIFPEELNSEIDVSAICEGKLILKKTATGYGGVAVQSCILDNNPVTVVYGHLKLASITSVIGTDLKTGDTLGQLGVAYSTQTDGERKHLHIGIHKGTAVNILGYVQTESALVDWLDPCPYVCQ